MRKLLVAVVLLLVLLCVPDVLAEGYRVILKNGSWVHARVEPAPEGSKTRIQLMGGGVAVLPASSVDWEATKRWNAATEVERDAGQAAAAREVPTETVTMVGEVKKQRVVTVGEEDETEAPASAAAGGQDDASSSTTRLSGDRARYNRLEEELEALRAEKRDLESSAANQVNLDEAADLRRQAAALDGRIQEILNEQRSLIIEGDTATSNVGDESELERRLRFLNAEISKLLQEKQQLERQAANMVNLDEAKGVRERAAALGSRIQAHEAERERLQARRNQ
jgi:DNA repair exonuclease SbcCD ATPase subunit